MHTALSAETHARYILSTLDADASTSLAISRATLHALVAMSPSLHSIADAALEREARRASGYQPAVAERVIATLEEARALLRQAVEEARTVQALEQALWDAAEALPDQAGQSESELFEQDFHRALGES